MKKISVIAGNSNLKLAKDICEHLKVSVGQTICESFPGGEIHVQIKENIRGQDVFIVQPTCYPPNDSMMELFLLIDAARRASAARITAVVPYYGYARQDRKDRPRVPISAKLVANLISTAGADRILTMDLHAGQIQGFFDIPVDHLYSINVLTSYFKKKKIKDLIVVSPDVGGIKMARAYSKVLNSPFAIVDKQRQSAKKTKVMNVIGDIKDKNVVIVDDLISTGGSLVEAANALRANGAKDVYAAIVHPVLADPAVERIKKSILKEVIVTDSIPIPKNRKTSKIKVLSVAPLLAETIRRIHQNRSVSSLFARAGVEA